jgi:hypothetical protein
VVPLDDSREWYRYHHLFAQVLQAELRKTEPGVIPALHQRACAWHRAGGIVGDAVSHALASGDTAEAVDLIARHWHGYVNAGRMRTVRGWLDSLTDDQIAAYPLAAHCGAWGCGTVRGAGSGAPLAPRHRGWSSCGPAARWLAIAGLVSGPVAWRLRVPRPPGHAGVRAPGRRAGK